MRQSGRFRKSEDAEESDDEAKKETADEIESIRNQYKNVDGEQPSKTKRKKYTDDDDDDQDQDDDQQCREKTVVEKQKDDEIKKAAELTDTPVDVIKIDQEISDLKKQLKEDKEDL